MFPPHVYPGRTRARGDRAVKYTLAFKPRARKDLKALGSDNLQRILEKIEALTDHLAGDVKRLTDYTPEFRLRIGDHRVLFEIDGSTIIVYRVVHHRETYR
jgi:mRNA interferase RelE/StbE